MGAFSRWEDTNDSAASPRLDKEEAMKVGSMLSWVEDFSTGTWFVATIVTR